MPLKDILLHINSYPEPTPDEALAQAVRFAAWTGAAVTGQAVQVDLRSPANWLAAHLVSLGAVCAEQEEKSLRLAKAALGHFEGLLRSEGVQGETRLTRADLYAVGNHLAGQARTRDLCLLPAMTSVGAPQSVAEAVIFGSGRPVILYQPGVADLPSRAPKTVVLAWDGSRCAARAMADALPILTEAGAVRVLTVVNEKAEATRGAGAGAVRHLEAHGVAATAEDVDLGRRRIGDVLEAYVAQHGAELLVMGAFGRTHLRDFVLGGATERVLREPKVALFLSH